MLNQTIEFLDECWATSLGCSVTQFRDGDRHVVATPQSTRDVKRPYPLRPDSISLVTYGKGWVLSVPSELLEQAKALCLEMSFSDISEEGDRLQEEWFQRGAKDEERATLRDTATYRPLGRLAESLKVRGWSHYVHWYCDPSSWDDKPIDKHVRLIREDDPEIWEQWLKWPGPIGGPGTQSEISEAFGYVLDGQLVSAAQLFVNSEDFAWEFGPSTLPEFRCRGFATEACRAATALILKHNRIPWYYYDHYNLPSSRTPQKLGYFLYSEGLFSHHG